MSKRMTGTIVGGVLKFDDPVNLPDQIRVSVTVEPLVDVEQRLHPIATRRKRSQ